MKAWYFHVFVILPCFDTVRTSFPFYRSMAMWRFLDFDMPILSSPRIEFPYKAWQYDFFLILTCSFFPLSALNSPVKHGNFQIFAFKLAFLGFGYTFCPFHSMAFTVFLTFNMLLPKESSFPRLTEHGIFTILKI